MNIKAGFEKISKYADDEGIIIPTRKTAKSAGYDFCVAEDTVVPSWSSAIEADFANELAKDLSKYYGSFEEFVKSLPYDLNTTATLVKKYGHKVTLVPTGIKAYMPDDWYLQLSVRSSLSNKHWLLLANGTGIIDADYYNNVDNEGHIYFQIINLLPFDVILKKGDCIGQGIFLQYGTVENDAAEGERVGGFGSTDANTST
jgi:dUTP pyrophosphatase